MVLAKILNSRSDTPSISNAAVVEEQPARKFLITQAYSTYNKGEAAIAIGIIETIKHFFPDSEIAILSPMPNEDSRHYSKHDVRNYERLLNTVGQRRKGIGGVRAFGAILLKAVIYMIHAKTHNRLPLRGKTKLALDIFRQADVVIIGGGGMFGGNKLRSIAGNLFPIILAKQFGKKVIVNAPSVEPFTSSIVRVATKFAFNKADIITVREHYSFSLLRSLGVKKPIYLTADPAFLAGHESLEKGAELLLAAGVPRHRNGKLRIGMTIRDFRFPGQTDAEIKCRNYLGAISSAIERILSETDVEIVLFATAINTAFNDDDRITSNQIRNSISENLKSRVCVLTQNYTPEEIKAMIGNMDIFVATRTHSAIFAYTMNIPVLNIACETHKNHGIMEMMDLGDYILDASAISTEKLVRAILRLIEERNFIAERISERLPIVKNMSLENGKYLLTLVNGAVVTKS